jgi:hypothetical protein
MSDAIYYVQTKTETPLFITGELLLSSNKREARRFVLRGDAEHFARRKYGSNWQHFAIVLPPPRKTAPHREGYWRDRHDLRIEKCRCAKCGRKLFNRAQQARFKTCERCRAAARKLIAEKRAKI